MWSRLAVLAGPGALGAFLVLGACADEFQPTDSRIDQGEARTRKPADASSSSSGSGGTSSGGSSGESPPPIDSGASSGSPPATCDLQKGVDAPFDMPGLVGADYRQHARLTPDELQVAFLQKRNPAQEGSLYDAYLAVRSSVEQPFGAPSPIANAAGVWAMSFSNDGLTLYLTSNADEPHIRSITRPALDQPFGEQRRITGVPEYSYSPFVTADDQLLFAYYPENPPSLLYSGALQGNSVSSPTLFYDGGGEIDYPALSADGNELFYGHIDSERNATYRRAVRQGEGWIESPMPGLLADTHEVTWISRDGCRVYLTNWRSLTLQQANRQR